jgi:hypothetical protein
MEATTTVSGVVTRTNEHGFCLEGHEGWLNISKYAKPAPLMPAKEQAVSIGLDKAGYVRTIEPVQQAPAMSKAATGDPAPAIAPETPATPEDNRQLLIVRECALKAAVELATIGAMANDVAGTLAIAEQLEAWVLRLQDSGGSASVTTLRKRSRWRRS